MADLLESGVKDKENNELGSEIVVTEAMIEAGINEFYDFRFGEDMRFVLESVYRSMAYEAPQLL